jgi:uncharacterized membrane protein YccC
MFGKPGTGAHSVRFMGVAIIDVILTIIGSVIISYYTKYSLLWVTIIMFGLGILAHRLFCVRTTVDKMLFN